MSFDSVQYQLEIAGNMIKDLLVFKENHPEESDTLRLKANQIIDQVTRARNDL